MLRAVPYRRCPKSEYRNPKQAQNTKLECFKPPGRPAAAVWFRSFAFRFFEFVSDSGTAGTPVVDSDFVL
jgi:hypothetical protein